MQTFYFIRPGQALDIYVKANLCPEVTRVHAPNSDLFLQKLCSSFSRPPKALHYDSAVVLPELWALRAGQVEILTCCIQEATSVL